MLYPSTQEEDHGIRNNYFSHSKKKEERKECAHWYLYMVHQYINSDFILKQRSVFLNTCK